MVAIEEVKTQFDFEHLHIAKASRNAGEIKCPFVEVPMIKIVFWTEDGLNPVRLIHYPPEISLTDGIVTIRSTDNLP